MTWSAYDGWEYGPRGVIPSESGFAHTGTIVYNKGCNFVVTHFDWILFNRAKQELNLPPQRLR